MHSFSVLNMFLVAICDEDQAKIERYEAMISGNKTVRNDLLEEIDNASSDFFDFICGIKIDIF